MSRCLFCLQEKERLTDEHVFPAALGGALLVKNSVCAECNNGFSKFEQPFAGELAPFRLLLQIPNRYGKVPDVVASVKAGEKEYDAEVKGDGKVQLKPTVTEVTGIKGAREFLHQNLTERQKEKLRHEASTKGHQFIESGPGNPVQADVHVAGDLKFIGSSEGLRTASKIAYVGLALKASPNLAMRESFAEIRSYIRQGAVKPTARLFVNEDFLQRWQQGPHQHSIMFAGRRDKKRVDAIVKLFGGLCYFVKLSDHYEGADFSSTLLYDAYRGETNDILVSDEQGEIMQTEDIATSDATNWDDLAAAGKSFCEYIQQKIRKKSQSSQE